MQCVISDMHSFFIMMKYIRGNFSIYTRVNIKCACNPTDRLQFSSNNCLKTHQYFFLLFMTVFLSISFDYLSDMRKISIAISRSKRTKQIQSLHILYVAENGYYYLFEQTLKVMMDGFIRMRHLIQLEPGFGKKTFQGLCM